MPQPARRVYPQETRHGWLPELKPGDYGRATPFAMLDGSPLGDAVKGNLRHFTAWELCLPTGELAGIMPTEHPVIEHPDGTISIARPIVMEQPARLDEAGKIHAATRRVWLLTRGAWAELEV